MSTTLSRDYSCKDEELPVICGFASTSLKRDLSDFTTYSPKFNQDYVNTFDTNIATAINVVDPQSETMERKLINDQMHTTMNNLIDPINHLVGYLTMAPSLKMSATDFGLTQLRNAITARDAEHVISTLHLVNANITTYSVQLTEEGMSNSLVAQFTTSAVSIADGKQKQHEILSNRRSIVQNNIGLLNNLNSQLVEILTVGKILYKTSNAAKLHDYTFSSLKSEVRGTPKTPVPPPAPTPTAETK